MVDTFDKFGARSARGGDARTSDMNHRIGLKRTAQLVVVVLCAAAAKFYYSTASVNQLRWILAPTTFLVELATGLQFEFESYAGYINGDRSFIIAGSCAGINFLITSFLMLSLRKLWRDRSQNISWKFIPVAALCAYLAALVANTVRITTALQLRRLPQDITWLSPNQLHRLEGIVVYFGFLLLLFLVSEKIGSGSDLMSSTSNSRSPACRYGLSRQSFFPLLIYYATTLGIPLANGAYRQGAAPGEFWEHSLFVILVPLIIILPLATLRFYRDQRGLPPLPTTCEASEITSVGSRASRPQ